MSKQIKALKTAIESLERLQAAFMLYDDWKGVDIYESTMNGINACKKALEDADNKEIGEYEIKAMLDDIEWYQQEQRKLIDRIKELEKKEWQSLSDDEIDNVYKTSIKTWDKKKLYHRIFSRAIEQALKELNAKK